MYLRQGIFLFGWWLFVDLPGEMPQPFQLRMNVSSPLRSPPPRLFQISPILIHQIHTILNRRTRMLLVPKQLPNLCPRKNLAYLVRQSDKVHLCVFKTIRSDDLSEDLRGARVNVSDDVHVKGDVDVVFWEAGSLFAWVNVKSSIAFETVEALFDAGCVDECQAIRRDLDDQRKRIKLHVRLE